MRQGMRRGRGPGRMCRMRLGMGRNPSLHTAAMGVRQGRRR